LGELATARLQYDFGYAWVGSDPYLASHTVVPALFYDWSRAGTTRLFGELIWNHYLFSGEDFPDGAPGGVAGDPCQNADPLCGPAGLNEKRARDRNGFGSVLGIDHAIPIGAAETKLRGGYRYQRYNARGSEYSHEAHEVRLGAGVELLFDLGLDLQASYAYRSYRHSSTFPDPDGLLFGQQYALSSERRRERVLRFDAIIKWYFSERLTASIRYSYLDNDSNVEVFDYDRNIIGAYLTLRTR
jgi:hypothetical protein